MPFLRHDYRGNNQVVLLGMKSASDKTVREKARADGYVIVTRGADFQELSMVWGLPPKVIRLKTMNQSRAATLKVLTENRGAIVEALVSNDLASVEMVLA